VFLAGCRPSQAGVPAGQVDSVTPRAEALRAFRSGLPRIRALAGGFGTREELVRGFVRALESADSASLAGMAVSRAEFAYLVYESSPQSLPPYDLSPSLMWFTLEGTSRRDIAKALQLFGRRRLGYVDHACADTVTEGANQVHAACTVRHLRENGDTASARLFGPIVQRDGQFKFLSYANKL
jgi:hypothetical protein